MIRGFTTMNRLNIALLLLIFSSVSCCSSQERKQQHNRITQTAAFTLPEIPMMLQSSKERADYLVSHYWDNFNFADTTLIRKTEIIEQAFVDYLNLFSHTTNAVVEKSISSMLHKAIIGSKRMFLHFTELYEKYLYEPNSPFRNEFYYIIVLRAVIADEQVNELQKIRPRYQLETALKNRPGIIAADFEFTLKSGRKMRLSEINTLYTVLFFNNPDCEECKQVKKRLSELTASNLKIVAIYPGEDNGLWKSTAYPQSWINGYAGQALREQQLYDLKAVPCLYLLDKDKRVVLKDMRVEELVSYLQAFD